MFRYTLRDESNHQSEVFRNLFMDLVEENREIWTSEFKEELRALMQEAINLEKKNYQGLPAGKRRRSAPR